MLTPDKRTVLENAADLLEKLGHAGAQPLRALIRDTRLESLISFALYGGTASISQADTGGVRLEVGFQAFNYQADIAVGDLRESGTGAVADVVDLVMVALETQSDRPVRELGENPLADCLAWLETTLAHGCPRCGSTVWPTSDPVSLTMTCNACGFQMRTPRAEG